MTDFVRRALRRKVYRRGPRGKQEIIFTEPDERVVLLVKFTIIMSLCLASLEVASLAFLHAWNSECFAALTGLVGTVLGVLMGHLAS
jgi:hypothetical protein